MDILDDELVRPVRGRFLHWREFMEDNVTFNFTDSKWHTTTHCARVLLLSQVIGHALGVEDQGQTITVYAISDRGYRYQGTIQ